MQKRPTWLIFVASLIMLYQIVWLIRVLQLPDNLTSQISLSIPLEIIVSSCLILALVYGIWTLMIKKVWAVLWVRGIIGIQLGYILLRLIIFAEADYDRQRLPFLVIIFLIVVGLLLLPKVFQHLHKSTKGEDLI